jgi:hypothetical protein
MQSLRILVFAAATAAALAAPVLSYAQDNVAPPAQAAGTAQQQIPQQAGIDYSKPQPQSTSAAASTYGAPMNGSYAAGHRPSQYYGPALFEHH